MRNKWKNNKKKILYMIGYGIILGLIYSLIVHGDLYEIIHHLRKAGYEILILLVLLQIFTQLLLIYQWHRITKVVVGHSSMSKVLRIYARGTVIEAITPGAKVGGEATRLYYIKKDFECTTDQAISIVVMQKSISMSVLLTICVSAFLYLCGNILGHHISILMQIILLALCIALIILMICFLFFSSKIEDLLSNMEGQFMKRIHKFVGTYSDTTKQLSKGMWLLQFVISVLVWGLFPMKMVILAVALGVRIPMIVILAITMTSYMMGMFPVTPGGLGTFEGTMVTLLALLSVEPTVGITISFVFRFITFWFVILVSALVVVSYNLRDRVMKVSKVG